MLAIDDYYRIAGHAETTLLDVMDAIPGGHAIEFNPARLEVQVPAAQFD